MSIFHLNPHGDFAQGLLVARLILARLTYPRPKRTGKPRVALYGHSLSGNLRAFFDYAADIDLPYSVEYFARDRGEYDALRQTGSGSIHPLTTLAGCRRLLSSDCVVTSHGPGVLVWLRLLAPWVRFADVWHGIGFKGFDDRFFKKTLHRYDRIFVGSDYQKMAYRRDWGFRNDQLRVTGYARVDGFSKAAETGKRVRRELGLKDDEPVILYAPTYRSAGDGGEIPFGLAADAFLSALHDLATARGGHVIFRLHMNSKLDIDAATYGSIIDLPQKAYPETNDLLCACDVLITDWSSIAADFYALGRPVVFLDLPPPKTHKTLTDLERVGDLARSIPELCAMVERALDRPGATEKHQAEARHKCFGDTLDGQSAARYDRELRALLALTHLPE